MPLMNRTVFEQAEKKLDKLYFQVGTKPLFYQNEEGEMIPLKDRKAIIRVDDNKVLCFPESGRKILSNEDALNLGKRIFKKMYPEIQTEELRVFQVRYPGSLNFCQIKMVHEDINFKVYKQDSWHPYLEVINSFENGIKCNYQLGFVRKLCANGMNVGTHIQFSLEEGMHIMEEGLDEKSRKITEDFIAMLESLEELEISEELMVQQSLAMFSRFTRIRPNRSSFSLDGNWLQEVVKDLVPKYSNELGTNGYAVLNVITDVISNKIPDNRFTSSAELMAISKLPQFWIQAFARETAVMQRMAYTRKRQIEAKQEMSSLTKSNY